MSLKSLLKSKYFLKNLAYIVGTSLGLIIVASILLKVYTHHGRTYRVPDLTGLTGSEVKREVKKNKLTFEIFDSAYVPEAIPGTVISQYPQSGNIVKESRTIFVTMSSVSPEKVKVPEIVDVSLREAQGRLISAGLKTGRIEYRPSEFFNLVLKKSINGQSIPKDAFVNKGTAIDLVVGCGLSDEKTIVPQLIGMQLDEAKGALEAIGLSCGTLVYDNTVKNASDSAKAFIWKQSPENSSSQYIEIGSSIVLWLSIQSDSTTIEQEITE